MMQSADASGSALTSKGNADTCLFQSLSMILLFVLMQTLEVSCLNKQY
jgi:hypothetical protein